MHAARLEPAPAQLCNAVQLSAKDALPGKRQLKNVDDEEFLSISVDKGGVRGPGGKSLKKRKHIEASSKKKGILCDSEREGVRISTHEKQFHTANDRSSDENDARAQTSNVDEYVLDLSYDENIDEEFGNMLNDKSKACKTLKDPMWQNLFNPRNIRHPRGKDWWPLDHNAEYIRNRLRRPLESDEQNIMRSECSRPIFEDKVTMTTNLGPELITYLKWGDPKEKV
ncbi:hypothetical protein NDU88_004350 [Pleurodeles waltl]|uniref:Uncharacterized protein n=1 Tax=Pleurodeles waltl TaxID=8319 RepID=A0AAV7WVK4_PLEWA|nr:hypothetical protein NDU88_004350 [Pleurodeles waltl]